MTHQIGWYCHVAEGAAYAAYIREFLGAYIRSDQPSRRYEALFTLLW